MHVLSKARAGGAAAVSPSFHEVEMCMATYSRKLNAPRSLAPSGQDPVGEGLRLGSRTSCARGRHRTGHPGAERSAAAANRGLMEFPYPALIVPNAIPAPHGE